MSVVPGDPGSLSACAATTAALGHALAGRAAALRDAVRGLGDGWPGRRSVTTRRRGAALADAAESAAGELGAVATVLQDQASDLAALLARARALEERVAAAGLQVHDGRVGPALGVLTAADPVADRRRAAAAQTLQTELDAVLALHRRRRDFALATLRASTDRLAGLSAALRGTAPGPEAAPPP